ncbi:1-deoxy-D-xylulose-5-phosphate synthase [Vibrio aerogenes CECT 7868]|uniref:1-deoxy-D-xylulose-5-phosphate synthase n=1 Tax=Vibrio aerogenes CECT 7868 TaxID=1216006 RepID=A0A1M5YRB0_9VIBR|nr:transketolase C-terminal domain-containing protein [Vibrio aerogenes]SHI14113.1 1-deoxy-D-xylulose-5-phosphate synthase [Vibrio aerogenes CECT 7868]
MANAEHFANIMVERFIEAVNRGVDLVPVVADSTSTAKIAPFIEAFPDRLVNVGIAEQALVGTAAGLALGGKVAVTCNAAPFLISRANEQVKVDVCYNNTNVKLFGLNSGASYGPLASTHHSIDDISVMRGFGNIEIYAPASPKQCRQIIDYAIEKQGPVYIRMDGKPLPEIFSDSYQFEPGRVDVIAEGEEIALIGMGSVMHEVAEAAATLNASGVSAKAICLSSIRPCDTDELARQLTGIRFAVTVEEHNVNGGVGAMVAEVIAEFDTGTRLKRLGIHDGAYALAGDRQSMRAYHGIDAGSVVDTALNLLREK